MPDVSQSNRPLSPHLSVYRPQISMVSSILTRITGISLLVGGLLVIWWFLAAATSPEAFALADGVLTSWLGDLVMLGSLWALWYHFLTGLRHLYWDTGRGLDLPTAKMLGWVAVFGSFILTALTVVLV